jgi:hypothetical protein
MHMEFIMEDVVLVNWLLWQLKMANHNEVKIRKK